MSQRLFTLVLALIFIAPMVQAAPQQIWTADLDHDANWSRITGLGTLLVGTEDSLESYDPETGQRLWAIEIDRPAPFNVREVGGTPLLLVTSAEGSFKNKTTMTAYNVLSGEALWSTGERKAMMLGGWPVPSQGIALMFANGYDKRDLGEGLLMIALDLESGEQRWLTQISKWGDVRTHRADHASKWGIPAIDLSGHQDPLVLENMVCLPFRGLHCYDLASGTELWGEKFKTADRGLKKAYAPLIHEDGVIYATGMGRIFAFKTDGSKLWESDSIRSARIAQTALTETRVIARFGGTFSNSVDMVVDEPLGVAAFDRATGEELWVSRDPDNGITNMLLSEDRAMAWVADGRNLMGYQTAANQEKPSIEQKLDFKRKVGTTEMVAMGTKVGGGFLTGGVFGGLRGAVEAGVRDDKDRTDIPVALFPDGQGNVVVRGSQHMLSYDPANGAINWSFNYEAPGVSNFWAVTMGAVTAFNTLGAWSQAYSATSYTGRAQGVSNAFSGFDDFHEMAARRYTAARSGLKRSYFLTNVEVGEERGPGLVGVSMQTGEVVAEVLLDEKEPIYAVDDLTDRLFFFKDGDELIAYDLFPQAGASPDDASAAAAPLE